MRIFLFVFGEPSPVESRVDSGWHTEERVRIADPSTKQPKRSGRRISSYILSLGNLSQTSGTQTDYFLGGALGSTRQLADDAGVLGLVQGFDPYGNPAHASGSASSVFGYAGQQTDASGRSAVGGTMCRPQVISLFSCRAAQLSV